MFELIIRTQKHLRLLILEASQMVCLSKCIFNMVLIVILFGFTWVLVLWNILPNTLISAAIQVDIIRLNWNLKLNRRRRTLSTPWDLKKFSCYGNTRNDALCMKKTPSPHSMLYQLIFDVIFSTTRNYNKSEMLFRFWLVCSREERWWSEWRRMQSLLSFGDMSIQLVKLNMLLRNEWSVMVFPHFGGDMNKQNCQILRWSKIIHHFIAAAKLTHHICAPISIPPRIVYILANADVMCMLWYESRLFGMLFLSISQLFPPPLRIPSTPSLAVVVVVDGVVCTKISPVCVSLYFTDVNLALVSDYVYKYNPSEWRKCASVCMIRRVWCVRASVRVCVCGFFLESWCCI